MRQRYLTSFLVVAGCIGGPELDEVGEREQHGIGIELEPVYLIGEHEQGKFILGGAPDLLFDGSRHVRVATTAVDPGHKDTQVAVTAAGDGANLAATAPDGTRYSGASGLFAGMILPVVGGGQVKIERAEPRGSGSSTTYFLRYRRNTWLPFVDHYCGDPDKGAVALRGSYDEQRIHHVHDVVEAITFACDDGVAAKCIDWGYIPGIAGPSADPVNNPSAWDYHQACTPMANADYCRIGEPHTREQTPILIRDFKAGAQPPPQGISSPIGAIVPPLEHPKPFPGDPDKYYIEAAWRPGDLWPICLSKVRWASLPLDPCLVGQSDHGLRDPRVNPAARTCDEFLTFDELRQEGALIVNASKMMDASLQRWRNPDPQKADVVTTMRGFYIPSAPVVSAPYPAPDLQRSTLPFGAAAGYVQYLGPDSMILRNLPGTLEEADMVELHAWQSGNDRVIASEAAAQSLGLTTSLGFEGFAFTFPTQVNANLQQLRVCTSGSDHDTRLTSSAACAPSGYAAPPLPP